MIDPVGVVQVLLAAAPVVGLLITAIVKLWRRLGDLRVELADYKTHVAENYVPIARHAAFETDIMRRLERIEDKIDRQASGAGAKR